MASPEPMKPREGLRSPPKFRLYAMDPMRPDCPTAFLERVKGIDRRLRANP